MASKARYGLEQYGLTHNWIPSYTECRALECRSLGCYCSRVCQKVNCGRQMCQMACMLSQLRGGASKAHVGGPGYLVFIRADHAGALKGLYNLYLPTIVIPFVDQRRDALIQGGYRAVHKRVPQEFKRRWRNESARLCGARQCPWQKVMPK